LCFLQKICFALIGIFLAFSVSAQQELHIHHINIENGDATLIGIYDVASQKYTSKILIDGGKSTPAKLLLPYIGKMVGTDAESFHFDYIILTHYHNDHYNGLMVLKTGKLTADSIIDPGGYRVDSLFPTGSHTMTRPANLKRATTWLSMLKIASHHTPEPFIKGRSEVFLSFGTTGKTGIGRTFTIGKIGTHDVEIECVAGWGNTISDSGIEPNPKPTRTNANDYTLAFIVSCGEFRYFIGGDLGGQNTAPYIDQETPLTKYLEATYPASVSSDGDSTVKGHICGFKANHHGSNNSNTASFMQGMRPAITITSAGNTASWHLPNPIYLQRLSAVHALSESSSNPSGTFNRGVYVTNLYNFKGFPSKTKANSLFKNKPGISYDYGNNIAKAKGSYLIKVTDENGLGMKSEFEVGRVDISKTEPYKKLAFFFCHAK